MIKLIRGEQRRIHLQINYDLSNVANILILFVHNDVSGVVQGNSATAAVFALNPDAGYPNAGTIDESLIVEATHSVLLTEAMTKNMKLGGYRMEHKISYTDIDSTIHKSKANALYIEDTQLK